MGLGIHRLGIRGFSDYALGDRSGDDVVTITMKQETLKFWGTCIERIWYGEACSNRITEPIASPSQFRWVVEDSAAAEDSLPQVASGYNAHWLSAVAVRAEGGGVREEHQRCSPSAALFPQRRIFPRSPCLQGPSLKVAR